MILPIHEQVRARVRAVLAELYGLSDADATVSVEYPPNRTLGDLGTPVAFDLARRLRKAPRAIAQEIAGALGPMPGITPVDAAPNGYLNVFLDRPSFLLSRLGVAGTLPPPVRADKTIVEHTAINPNKAAHIGHLRNSALGDTLVRVLRFRGNPVEVQNYIDDTGVQVADVVVGFQVLEQVDLAAAKRIAASARFDYYCWDLYARVTEWYDGDQQRLQIRAATLHDIEHGTEPTASLAAFIADTVVRCHLKTMARLNIDYQLLTWEGDILRLKFWARAFDVLKQTGAVFLQTEGRLAGCWVMKIDDTPAEADGEATETDDAAEEREKVIVRSNGTVTYVGKDMAYQFWKSGLLGHDFHYRKFATRMNGDTLWATTSDPARAVADHPAFGAAAATYNVIDVRQAYLQKLLKQALTAIGHPAEAERLTHFSYEMVALSHATATELGFAPPPDSGDAKRPFVEVSGRKGLGVKADDLIDRVIDKALAEVDRRQSDLPAADRRKIAEQIGIAAVRYFLIKYSRTKVIAFDIDEALNFEGESGPYLQYAVVRANNIFQKLQDRLGLDEAAMLAPLPAAPPEAINGAGGDHELWGLVFEASRLDDVVEQVVRSLEFAVLAKYGFGLAQLFNAFYHRAPILNEERDDVRRWRAAAVAYFRQQLTRALDLMGVAVPPRM
ncbi:MAG: arginine--tRNA ligase [Acidobacteria bacterium RIFCSPLOWO2_12_FULL_67_14b]|nr:MAG: arginine--tRNA ligase [Acidobacteria bacterium RIFCSPLOWO2_12_FULL_67_14b]